MTAEQFYHELHHRDKLPLKPFVVEFLKTNLPFLQEELAAMKDFRAPLYTENNERNSDPWSGSQTSSLISHVNHIRGWDNNRKITLSRKCPFITYEA